MTLKVVTALIVATLAMLGCGSNSSAPARATPAQQLAVLERKGPVDPSDPLVARFSMVLARLAPACVESRHNLASYIWATHVVLAQDGYRASILHVAHALLDETRKLSPTAKPTNCQTLLAAYVVMVEDRPVRRRT